MHILFISFHTTVFPIRSLTLPNPTGTPGGAAGNGEVEADDEDELRVLRGPAEAAREEYGTVMVAVGSGPSPPPPPKEDKEGSGAEKGR